MNCEGWTSCRTKKLTSYKVITFCFKAIIINWCIRRNFTQFCIFTIDKKTLGNLFSIVVKGIENILETCEIVWMVKVNVGNNRVFWVIRHKVALIFVRFKDKIFGIGRTTTGPISNQEAGICDVRQDMRQHTCRWSFSMRSSYSHANKITHKAT